MKISFIDTNIWVYAHVQDSDSVKHDAIISFLERQIKESQIISSVQAINEFHWVLEKKYGISQETIEKKYPASLKFQKSFR